MVVQSCGQAASRSQRFSPSPPRPRRASSPAPIERGPPGFLVDARLGKALAGKGSNDLQKPVADGAHPLLCDNQRGVDQPAEPDCSCPAGQPAGHLFGAVEVEVAFQYPERGEERPVGFVYEAI